MTSVAVVTLGCAKNEADSARLVTLLRGRFEVIDRPDEADAVVINTCGFMEAAAEESLAAVMEASRLPKGPVVAAVGCLASRYADALAGALPEAGLIVALQDIADLDRALQDALAVRGTLQRPGGMRPDSGGAAGHDALWSVPPAVSGQTAYLTISDGCDRRCSYCTIPSFRGGYRSRPPADVLAEAALMAAQGVRELVLVGQDVSAYGSDCHGTSEETWTLARLVRTLVATVGDNVWIRLLYLQPDGVSDDLLRTVAETPSVARYFDIPIQHVDARVLRAMGRGGDAGSFAALATRIRGRVPGAVLRTTVICGFPGEDARAFGRLEAFVGHGHFDYVGVFAYSREEGTRAAAYDRSVRSDVRERRRAHLAAAALSSYEARASRRVGTVLEVLVEGPSDDPRFDWMGRFFGQAPDADGVVYWSGAASTPFAQVRVESVEGYDLTGVAC